MNLNFKYDNTSGDEKLLSDILENNSESNLSNLFEGGSVNDFDDLDYNNKSIIGRDVKD